MTFLKRSLPFSFCFVGFGRVDCTLRAGDLSELHIAFVFKSCGALQHGLLGFVSGPQRLLKTLSAHKFAALDTPLDALHRLACSLYRCNVVSVGYGIRNRIAGLFGREGVVSGLCFGVFSGFVGRHAGAKRDLCTLDRRAVRRKHIPVDRLKHALLALARGLAVPLREACVGCRRGCAKRHAQHVVLDVGSIADLRFQPRVLAPELVKLLDVSRLGDLLVDFGQLLGRRGLARCHHLRCYTRLQQEHFSALAD